ncbi:UvrD-helicase domain-containing protein [Treponema sp.]|uniref:UvrD-helicase domain-containing protein n=1 Tax=Treponema sp. TaxID=166 RepID=UPI003F00F443
MNFDYQFLNEPLSENPADSKTPDSFQIKAITKRDNAVVSAGAGSGKTDVLALRYAFLLMTDENLHVRNILALTFTKEAASEIYDRIYKKLNAFVKFLDEKKYALQVRLAKRALDEFADARIQTLDSYSGSIVRLGSSRYGIRPDFTTGSSSCDRIVEDAALPFVLKHRGESCFSFYSQPGKIEEFAEKCFASPILEYTSVATKSGFFCEHFQIQKNQIAEAWNSFFNIENAESVSVSLEEIKRLLETIDKKNAFTDEVQLVFDDGFDFESFPVLDADSFLEENADLLFQNTDRVCSKLKALCSVNMQKGGNKETIKAIKNEIKKIKALFPQILAVSVFLKNLKVQKRMFELMDEFLDEVNTAKRISGSLSFKDVSDLSLRILIEQPDIRRQQKSLIKKIMIDEFQDNNKKNKELLYLVSETDGSELLLENKTENEFFAELEKHISPDKLFFVGDEKQSIYKFRGADVSVFNNLKHSLRDSSGLEDGTNLSMTNNYRSSASLLYSFNMMFGSNEPPLNKTEIPSIFYCTDSLKSYEAEYSRNATKKDCEIIPVDKDTIPVHLCLLHSGKNSDGTSFADIVKRGECLNEDETLAYFIARKISELAERDSDFNSYAILDNSRSGRFYLKRYLSLFNIPYTVDRQTDVFSEGIANDFYNFLRFCVYPSDSNAFAAFLSSPFAGLSIQGVQNILASSIKKQREGGIQFLPFEDDENLFLSDSDMEKYTAAKKLYMEQRELILSQSLTKSLEFLWYKTGYYFETLLNRNLSLYAEQFDLLYETARQAEADGKSIAWFVDQLAASKKKEVSSYAGDEGIELDMKGIVYPVEKPDAVRIMTIHQSKGLQFKHVFIVGIWKNPIAQKTGKCFFDEDGFAGKEPSGVSLCAYGEGGNYFSLRQKEDSAQREFAEQKRKIYVAVTRAEKDVYLVGSLARSDSLKKFDESDDAEKDFNDSISLMHRLSRFYYQKEIYADNDFSCGEYCNSPLFRKQGAPFDFIKINPVSSSVRSREHLNLDMLRHEKINLFTSLYEKTPFEMQPDFPAEYSDKTETPSGLEKIHSQTTVVCRKDLKKNPLYDSVDAFLKNEQENSDEQEDCVSAEFDYSDFGKLAHSCLESLVATGSGKSAEDFLDGTVRKKLSENVERREILLKTVLSMCAAFEKSPLGKEMLDAKSSGRLCKAENKFKFLLDNTIFTGSMDLVFQDGGGNIVIADYKTDRAAKPEMYIAQLSCYRKAAAEIFHVEMKNIKTVLYYLRYDSEVDISDYTE